MLIKRIDVELSSNTPVMTWKEYMTKTWMVATKSDIDTCEGVCDGVCDGTCTSNTETVKDFSKIKIIMHSGLSCIEEPLKSSEYKYLNHLKESSYLGQVLFSHTAFARLQAKSKINNNVAYVGDFEINNSINSIYEYYHSLHPFINANTPYIDKIPIKQWGYKTSPLNKATIVFAYIYGFNILVSDLSTAEMQTIIDNIRLAVQELSLEYSGTIINYVNGLFVLGFKKTRSRLVSKTTRYDCEYQMVG
jgi:hypothetical protein